MKNKLSQAVAASIVAVGLLFAAPAAAQAYTPTQPEVIVSSNVPYTVSGSVYTFSSLEPGSSIDFTLTGEGVSSENLAVVKLAVASTGLTKTAGSDGTSSVTLTLPAEASGQYVLSATGTLSSAEAGGSSTLPSTGGDSDSLLGIWIGGGALVLAGATIAVGASVRRGRQQADA